MGAFGTKGGRKTLRALGMAGSCGFLMAISVLLGYYVGHLLDRHFGTDPWLMLLCLLLGVVLGFVGLFRVARALYS